MKKTPVPQGKYIPASRYGSLVYTSGMTSRSDGILMFNGKIRDSEPIATYKEMKAQIRKLENENDELKKQLSEYQPYNLH